MPAASRSLRKAATRMPESEFI